MVARYPAGSSSTGVPPQSRRPAAGASSVAKRRSRLDLPLPFGPISTKASPAPMRQSTPAKTSRSPRRQARFSPISSIVSGNGDNPSGLKKAAPEGENRSCEAAGRGDRPETRFGGQTCKGEPYAAHMARRLRPRNAQIEAIWWSLLTGYLIDRAPVLDDLAVIRQTAFRNPHDFGAELCNSLCRFGDSPHAFGRLAHLDVQTHLIRAHRPLDDQPCPDDRFVPPDDFGDLLRMHKHAAHLCCLIGAAHPALDAVIGPAARAGAGQQRREIAGRKAKQRVFRRQRRHHNFADLSRRHRVAGSGLYQLDDDSLVEHHAGTDLAIGADALIGDQPEIGGAVALQGRDAAVAKLAAQYGRKRLGADQRLFDRTENAILLGSAVEQDFQK